MQESTPSASQTKSQLSNPLLDFLIAGIEAQLRAWQAFQVEGTRFVAKRINANLDHLRALGHCSDTQSASECQRAFFANAQKDYTEEWARLAATGYALSFGQLSGLGAMFGQRASEDPFASEPARQPEGRAPASRPLSEAA